MRLLLDECVDRRLAAAIPGHFVRTVPEAGWAAFTNGSLLAAAEKEFDALITVDRGLAYQQDLSRFKIAVIVLRARSNRVDHLLELVPSLLQSLPFARAGEVTWVGP